ncbi:Fluoroquinolones export ATP-binding protein [Clostridium vincentii]|uniref:Fluoroquinolones export ATP-binding protein n=1 Tax=Clostridium vincentii TaxID=52704 RepID=A0A2T0BK88_9CLOT|nr:Fluoroquinolones export ATP-binding protein [Clostridium vincentii]
MVIKVEDLAFSYTDKPFLENINFQVEKGEIFGFLGPSGAGKSTLQKVLTGLLTSYSGSAVVNGMESKKHDNSFYEKIGVDFEFPSLYEKLTAKQNLEFFGSLYKKRDRSIDELLERVGLQNDSDKKVSAYSKGMKSRLNFIKSLLHEPNILFLDEPTSGLDPTNNRKLKDIILEEKKKGTTIILTTHNMEDATELCDRVAFIVDGKVKALDTPHNLIMRKGASKIYYTYMENGEKQGECLLEDTCNDIMLKKLLLENRITSIHSSEPNLNDIFMDVTGRVLQ